MAQGRPSVAKPLPPIPVNTRHPQPIESPQRGLLSDHNARPLQVYSPGPATGVIERLRLSRDAAAGLFILRGSTDHQGTTPMEHYVAGISSHVPSSALLAAATASSSSSSTAAASLAEAAAAAAAAPSSTPPPVVAPVSGSGAAGHVDPNLPPMCVDVFDMLMKVFGFQVDSVRNQRDSLLGILTSRMMGHLSGFAPSTNGTATASNGGTSSASTSPQPYVVSSSAPNNSGYSNNPTVNLSAKLLIEYRDELLLNYTRWCGHLGIRRVDYDKVMLDSMHDAPYRRQVARASLEVSLYLLIWGEAANLRFCPEFLCFVFHMCGNALVTNVGNLDVHGVVFASFLEDLIEDAYNTVAEQVAFLEHSSIDHVKVKNYDDFNEVFWRRDCLTLELKNMFLEPPHGQMKRLYQKTYLERQSWTLCIMAFWRVHTFLITSLHALIVLNTCFQHDYCQVEWYMSPCVTLYVCSLLGDTYALIAAFLLKVQHGGSAHSVTLIGCRWAAKFLFLIAMVGAMMTNQSLYISICSLACLWSMVAEAWIWLGVSMLPSSFISTTVCAILGVDVVNIFTRVHRMPPLLTRIYYTVFWLVVMTCKLAFSYYVVLNGLLNTSIEVWNTDVGSNLQFWQVTVQDNHNVCILIALWMGSVAVYFIDVHVWFVLGSNIVAAFEGLSRRVGDIGSSSGAVSAFDAMHKKFWSSRVMLDSSSHAKFAYVWNEIVESWREEDIITDEEVLRLRYFLVNAREWVRQSMAGSAQVMVRSLLARNAPLMPEFVCTGAIQRLVKACVDFSKESVMEEAINRIKYLDEKSKILDSGVSKVKNERQDSHLGMTVVHMARDADVAREEAHRRKKALAQSQHHFLVSNGARNMMTNLALQQFFLALAVLVDGLCRDNKVSDALWRVQYALREGTERANAQTLWTITTLSRQNLLFKVWVFPGVVGAMTALVDALCAGKYKACEALLDKMLKLLCDMVDTGNLPNDCSLPSIRELCVKLTECRLRIEGFRKDHPEGSGVLVGPAGGGGYDTGSSTISSSSISSSSGGGSRRGSGDGGDGGGSGGGGGGGVTEAGAAAQAFAKENTLYLKRIQCFLKANPSSEPGRLHSDEAKRRMHFFMNSIFVKQPQDVGRVSSMAAFSTLTPYYKEDVVTQLDDLKEKTEDGVTVLEYLRTIYNDEWDCFIERMTRTHGETALRHLMGIIFFDKKKGTGVGDKKDSAVGLGMGATTRESTAGSSSGGGGSSAAMEREAVREAVLKDLQLWCSHRAQTLTRTVRGFMKFGRAVQLLAAVEDSGEFQPIERSHSLRGDDDPNGPWVASTYITNCKLKLESKEFESTRELAMHSYRYVVAAQVFKAMKGASKEADRQKALELEQMCRKYPGLCIAYVEEKGGSHYSVLDRWDFEKDEMMTEYKVKLPGKILVGEGKPNNQNHAIIFTRGEAVQAIDMNQDQGLECAFKCKQLMAEFEFGRGEKKNIGRIVGYRENVFTHNVSSPANFFSLQELNFVTAAQRVVDSPLDVRFHYGHPDLFDKVSVMTFGGMSKASKAVNLSEDIFAGFNWVLRGGKSTQADYVSCGKGRDTGVSQITGFTAKISMGNGMQCRSRDVARLAAQFDFARLLSFYFSTVGGFMNQVFLIMAIFLFMYSRVYIAFDAYTGSLVNELGNVPGVSAQYALQLGFLLIIPIPLNVSVESGFVTGAGTLVSVVLRLAPLFFVFSTGTNAYYVNAAIMSGQAVYQATGRGFTIAHERFLPQFRAFLLSHYSPAFELLVLLIIYGVYTPLGSYLLETFSVYLLVIGWLWAPIIYNAKGLAITYVQEDAVEWWVWMQSKAPDPSSAWSPWFAEMAETDFAMRPHKKAEAFLRRLRYGLLAWGFLQQFDGKRTNAAGENTVGLFWIMVIVLFLVLGELYLSLYLTSRKRAQQETALSYHGHRASRMAVLAVLLAFMMGLMLMLLLAFTSAGQIMSLLCGVLFMHFMVVSMCPLFIEDAADKIHSVSKTYQFYHICIAAVIMLPVWLLALLPFFTSLQTRMLYNPVFSDRLEIARIFVTNQQRLEIGGTNTKKTKTA